jgi:hypothetical protein
MAPPVTTLPRGSASESGVSNNVLNDSPPPSQSTVGPPRATNFNTWELLTMCRAYASASDDPVRGVNQRGPMFWGRVKDLWHEAHRKTDISIKQNAIPRTQEQIQTRWKALAKDMNVFFGHLKHIETESPSGVPEDEYVDLAIDRYNQCEKRRFGKGLKECIPYLQNIVRFTPHQTSGATLDPIMALQTGMLLGSNSGHNSSVNMMFVCTGWREVHSSTFGQRMISLWRVEGDIESDDRTPIALLKTMSTRSLYPVVQFLQGAGKVTLSGT